MRYFLCIVGFSLCFLSMGCNKKSKDSIASLEEISIIDQLQGTWKLIELDNRNVFQFEATLQFQDTLATAYSGCNTMSQMIAKSITDDQNLIFDLSASNTTLIGCPVKHIEQQYFDLLQNNYHVIIKGKVIVLSTITGIEMLFTKKNL